MSPCSNFGSVRAPTRPFEMRWSPLPLWMWVMPSSSVFVDIAVVVLLELGVPGELGQCHRVPDDSDDDARPGVVVTGRPVLGFLAGLGAVAVLVAHVPLLATPE